MKLKIRFSETPKYGDSQQKKVHAIILRRTDSSGLFRRPFIDKFFFFSSFLKKKQHYPKSLRKHKGKSGKKILNFFFFKVFLRTNIEILICEPPTKASRVFQTCFMQD